MACPTRAGRSGADALLVARAQPDLPARGGRPSAPTSSGGVLTAPVVALFEQHWATGAHYTAVDAGRDVSTEPVRQVVALLARGMKDEAVARRLGVSTRTMRRLVAATMDELGAQSRFQAGIEAVRRGFVE